MTDLSLPHDELVGDGSNWDHDILFNVLGEAPGSSGASLVCEDQMAVCAVVIGHVGGGMVAEPIERFNFWWAGVENGDLPQFGPEAE